MARKGYPRIILLIPKLVTKNWSFLVWFWYCISSSTFSVTLPALLRLPSTFLAVLGQVSEVVGMLCFLMSQWWMKFSVAPLSTSAWVSALLFHKQSIILVCITLMLGWNVLFGNIAQMMAMSFRLLKNPLLFLASCSSTWLSSHLRSQSFYWLDCPSHLVLEVLLPLLHHTLSSGPSLYKMVSGCPWIKFLGWTVLGYVPLFTAFKASSFISMFLFVLHSFCFLEGVHIHGGAIGIWTSRGVMGALLVGVWSGVLRWWWFLKLLGVGHLLPSKIRFSLSIALDLD